MACSDGDPTGHLFDPNALAEVSLSPDWVYTVIYDGHCEACGRLVSSWIRCDRNGWLDVLPSQTPGVRQRFHQIPPSAFDESLQVVGRDGRVWQGAQAFARVLAVLPAARVPAVLHRIGKLGRLAETAYRLCAVNRPRRSCSEHCGMRPTRATRGTP